ncbi:MAG: alanine racemase [Ignavibacteriaceae bacterium]|nr:alanine racemase [Ignavibacteriaceae bacterium]
MRPTYALISLSNLKRNFLNIKKKVKNSKIMAVVKADAYGHGVKEIVFTLNSLESLKPDYYAVAFIDEAIELRSLGISEPILIFEPIFEEDAESIYRFNLIPTVFSQKHIEILEQNRPAYFIEKLKLHVKVDTGMNRLGIPFSEAVEFTRSLSKLKNFEIDGIYTHLATSDERNKVFAKLQLKRFNDVLNKLKSEKINYGLSHAANSGAILDLPEAYYDMVRPGVSLYGNYPSLETSESIKLYPVMSIISHIASVKQIKKGESVSYGRKFIANKTCKIAAVPIGYADGFSRSFTNRFKVLINGKYYNQVGTVTMDRIMINVELDNVKIGDEVILLGEKRKQKISAWDWSKKLGTIPYEITCGISKRVRRIYTY